MSDAAPAPLVVEFTGPARNALTKLAQEARISRRYQAFMDCARDVENKLKLEASSWGDPIFNLSNSKLPVQRGILQMLQIDYVVYLDQGAAVIVMVRPMPGWGFSENP